MRPMPESAIFTPGTRVNFAGKSYRVHPPECNAVAQPRAFFDALAKYDQLPDAHARAVAASDAIPDCNCFAESDA